jgi:serine phosphatase RsbU (regulator of sigma subunit)
VCDGLGHGAPAAQATRRVLDEVAGLAPMEPDELLLRLNAALVTTRGAAVSAAVADARTGALTFAGAGNVSGCVARDDGTSSFVAHPGTVGAGLRTTRAFSHVWPADGLLILHSDGLQTRWDLRKYPGLMRREPSLVAAVLWRDFLRGRDDVTVLVARRQEVRA